MTPGRIPPTRGAEPSTRPLSLTGAGTALFSSEPGHRKGTTDPSASVSVDGAAHAPSRPCADGVLTAGTNWPVNRCPRGERHLKVGRHRAPLHGSALGEPGRARRCAIERLLGVSDGLLGGDGRLPCRVDKRHGQAPGVVTRGSSADIPPTNRPVRATEPPTGARSPGTERSACAGDWFRLLRDLRRQAERVTGGVE